MNNFFNKTNTLRKPSEQVQCSRLVVNDMNRKTIVIDIVELVENVIAKFEAFFRMIFLNE